MFKSRFFPSLIAFAISFLITWLISRFDLGRALATGVVTLGACFVGIAMYADQSQYHLRRRSEELREHIRALQRRRMEAYEEWTMIAAERDRIAASFDFLQMQLQQLQVKSSDLWQQKEALSWNLTNPRTSPAATDQMDSLKGKLQQLQQQEMELNRTLANTLSAKQRAESSLHHTESELNQLQAAIAEQQSLKRQLAQEVLTLTEQKQQLESTVGSLQPQVNNLEHYKTELNQFLQSAEPKRQQIETGSKTLHSAIEQLQRQIVSLHGELINLEGQIVDRRQQKDELDQELATLKQQAGIKPLPDQRHTGVKSSPERFPSKPTQPEAPSDPGNGDTSTTDRLAVEPETSPSRSTNSLSANPVSFVIASPHQPEVSAVSAAISPTLAPVVPPALDYPSGLPAEWIALMMQLPESEFQALQAIVEDGHPAAKLKQIAEANLTMPELLVDAINERALETIGDMILEPGTGAGAEVTPDHQVYVKKLIELYLNRD